MVVGYCTSAFKGNVSYDQYPDPKPGLLIPILYASHQITAFYHCLPSSLWGILDRGSRGAAAVSLIIWNGSYWLALRSIRLYDLGTLFSLNMKLKHSQQCQGSEVHPSPWDFLHIQDVTLNNKEWVPLVRDEFLMISCLNNAAVASNPLSEERSSLEQGLFSLELPSFLEHILKVSLFKGWKFLSFRSIFEIAKSYSELRIIKWGIKLDNTI